MVGVTGSIFWRSVLAASLIGRDVPSFPGAFAIPCVMKFDVSSREWIMLAAR